MNKRTLSTSNGMDYLLCPSAKQIKLSLPICDESTKGHCSNGSLATKLSPKKVNNLVDDLLNGVNLDEDDFSEAEDESANVLDLRTWKRCIVDNIQYNKQETIIYGYQDLNVDGKRMICRLQHAWANCKLQIGDVVSITAVWASKYHSFCVSSMHGFLVVRPDFLVSGTTVLGGLFCMRKAVLSDRFKGIEAAMRIMTVGSIVHELFQIVLRRKLTTREDIKEVSEEMLSDDGMAYTLYASSMNSADARKEFDDFLEKIYSFVQRYISQTAPANKIDNKQKDDNFTGTIDSIRDIEENIWIPRLGLKGKVDVSIHVRHRLKNGSLSKEPMYMPLELKTGRASFSPEHTGQLILYQMMMSDCESKQIDSGLLLYLREGVMREIKGSHNEQRDLILLRNEISYYLAKQYEAYASFGNKSTKEDNVKNIDVNDPDLLSELLRLSNIPDLPEPINRANVCSQCPYNVLCSVYLTQDMKTFNALEDRHPMREIVPLVTSHLSDSHLNYFFHWVGLLMLEHQENKKSSPMKALWLQTAEQREKNGIAVTDLILDKNVVCQSDSEFIHEFIAENKDLTARELAIGSYLVVSISRRVSIAAGRVIALSQNCISLILERNLLDRYGGERFILDKYESQTNALFNMSNLGALLDDTEAATRLRTIVIDRQRPTFDKSLPKIVSTKGKPILLTLNRNQRAAILKALTAKEYFLLKGLPGTGKTQTLAALIRLLVLMGKSVLITSHTHSAVDNLLIRLMKSDASIKFIRLGSASRIRRELKEHSEDFFTKNCKTPDDLTAIYDGFNVFGVTCFGSGHPLLTQKVFDICLVDESTQVFQPTVLRPLFSAKKIILVGDPDQLPPIVRSPVARHLGADESLFARLDSSDATMALTLQYRMNKTITKLANDLTYNGALQCANDEISNATLRTKTVTKSKWLQRILTPHIDQSVIFLNTGNVMELKNQIIDRCKNSYLLQIQTKAKNGGRCYINYCEAAIILAIINELKAMNIQSEMIGVIAPYGLQVELLRIIIEEHIDNGIEVNTVDQYQGRDKEVIIYSCTRTESPSDGNTKTYDQRKNEFEILDDQRRLTVAITRAKHKLIMIGDMVTLESYRPFKKLVDSMGKMNKFQLANHQQGFEWRNVLSVFN